VNAFSEKKVAEWSEFRRELFDRGLYATFESVCLKYGTTVAEVFQERTGGAHVCRARQECMRYQITNGWSRFSVSRFWKRDHSYIYKLFPKSK